MGLGNEPYINVVVDEATKKRMIEQDQAWNGGKLIALLAVSLGIALVILWAMANVWYWKGWL